MKYELQTLRYDNIPQPENSMTLSEMASIFHRRRWLIAGVFSAIFLTVALITFLIAPTYVTSAKVFIKKERAENVVSATEDTKMVVKSEVSESALNSESEIFLSTPLLQKVVMSCGLDKIILEKRHDDGLPMDSSIVMSVAIAKLKSALSAEPVPKSSIIKVSYESENPRLAAAVVNDLCRFYVDRHLEVHKNIGVYAFFSQQADVLQQKLKTSGEELREFEAKHGIVAIDQQRQLALQQLSTYEAQLNAVRANGQEAAEKVEFLTKEIAATPEFIQSQSRTAYNAVIAAMKKELVALQTETQSMLAKLQPNSKEARDLKARIAQLEGGIRREEMSPTPAITADVTRAIVDYAAQLSQARSSIGGFMVQANSLSQAIQRLKAQIADLESSDLTHQSLLRDWELANSNYLLYVKKQEEARISEALDQEKFANVSIIEPATVPLSPSRPNKMLNLAMGFLFALMASFGTAYGMSFFDSAIRSKRDVEYHLNVPVLAAIPESNGQAKLLQESSFDQF